MLILGEIEQSEPDNDEPGPLACCEHCGMLTWPDDLDVWDSTDLQWRCLACGSWNDHE